MKEMQSGLNYKRITLAAIWRITPCEGCVCVWLRYKSGPVMKYYNLVQDDGALSLAHNKDLAREIAESLIFLKDYLEASFLVHPYYILLGS